jgi:hypothetical protein
MIHLEIDHRPMDADEVRTLVLSGSESFTVQIKCFVDDPPGFRDCPACSRKNVIRAGEPLRIQVGAAFKGGRGGNIELSIVSADGEVLVRTILVNERRGSSTGGMTAGA